MCAIESARRGLNVLVLERQQQVGGKYCYTSMGAGAVSNVDVGIDRFHGRNARFVRDALNAFPLESLREWFADRELPLRDAEYYGLVEPADGGPEVISAMLDALAEAKGQLETGIRVESAQRKGDTFVCTSDSGQSFKSRALVMACGGANLPQLGGALLPLTKLGHELTEQFPSLVPLTVAESWPGTLPGLWMDVELKLRSGKRVLAESTGSMLFTSGALTGEAVFNISLEVEPALADGHELELAINFHPGMAREDVAEWLRRVFGERSRERAEQALDHVVPRKLAVVLLERQKVKRGARVMQLTESQREGLLREMIDMRLTVTGTLGMPAAESASGGVNVREIDPRTFESRKTPGLYVVGHVLDINGDWGGFEQHFALAGGRLAGLNLLQ